MGKPGNTWGHRKYSALKTPLAYAFGFFLETNACKHMQTRSRTHRSHSEDMTLFSEMYALQGVPMTTLARSIPSISKNDVLFGNPTPLEYIFQRRVFPRKKLNIPGDPGKTKPVKYIKPPPQNKRSWGGLDIPTHGSYI